VGTKQRNGTNTMAILSFTHKVEINQKATFTHKGLVNALQSAMVSGEGAYIEITTGGTFVCNTFVTPDNLKRYYAGGTFDHLQDWISGAVHLQPESENDDDETDFMHWR